MEMIGPQTLAVGLFSRRVAEHRDLSAQGMCDLHAHMAQAAQSDNRHFLAGPRVPMPQWGVERNPGAEQRRAGAQRKMIRHAQNVVLVDHDVIGIAAHGGRAVFVATVVGPHRNNGAVLLQSLLTLGAGAAGIDHASNPHLIANLVFCDATAHRGNDSGDLVARDHGEDGATPLIAGLVNIGVADPAKLDVDGNIVLAGFAPFESIGRQRSLGGGSGVTFSFDHDVSFVSPRD